MTVPFRWTFSFFLQLHFGLWSCSIWLFYYVPWWYLTYCSCNYSWLWPYCGWKFCEACGFWGNFCYQLKKCLCNVCWNGFTRGWVKPYYVLLSRFWFFWFWFFFRVSSYSTFTILKTSWLKKFFDSLSEMEFGNCLVISGGWFDDEWMESNFSLTIR